MIGNSFFFSNFEGMGFLDQSKKFIITIKYHQRKMEFNFFKNQTNVFSHLYEQINTAILHTS